MPDSDDVEKAIIEVSKYYEKRSKKKEIKALDTVASREHAISYNSPSDSLEPVYFWILDLMKQLAGKVEKIYDNFTSTPGSGHFGELQQRATIMQQQAAKIMGDVNVVVKSVLNLIYSLKEFQMRLSHYKLAKSKNPDEASSGMLALKQIWLDSVDVKRGNTSVKGLALSGQAPFAMLIDAFLAAENASLKDKSGNEIDLNERVKRLLQPRVAEFFEWKDRSEKELTKRYEIEKTYLKSQVNSLKLYTRWAKPYLKAAEELRMQDQSKNPDLVNVFNTILLQLTLMGSRPIDFSQSIINKDLPQSFKNFKIERKYNSVVLVDFKFRGIPQRIQQGQSGHYAFGGLVDVKFRAYALNDDELALVKYKLDENDLQDSFKLIEGMTDDTLKQIQEDIDYFLKEEDKEEQLKKELEDEDVNPFSALIGLKKKDKAKLKSEKDQAANKEAGKILSLKEQGIKPDSWEEQYARKIAEDEAKSACYTLYDVYKKAHGMMSSPDSFASK